LQRKILKKRDLEIALSKIQPHPKPKVWLEQYTIPPDSAAHILHLAAFTFDDVVGKVVWDLGCGTGRLGIGAAILGAKEVVGVDIDLMSVEEANRSAKMFGVNDRTSWVATDVDSIHGSCDTVIQNPPFGVQRRTIDRRFIQKALEVGKVVYSLHKSGVDSREFINRFVRKCEGNVKGIFQMTLRIPLTFKFHSKRTYPVKVDLYRIVKGKNFEWENCG
jgi:putative methylase